MVREEIVLAIKKTLAELGIEGIQPQVEVPSDSSKGDYASNIALVVFGNKELGIKNKGYKTPLELAQKIVTLIQNSKFIILDKVEVAPPGFINFFLSKDYLLGQLGEVQDKKEQYGCSSRLHLRFGEPRKIMVEYTDPNPFKEFHIGHLYSNAVGESLSRLFESQGATVWRVNYQGDIGLHIAKSLYAMMQISNLKSQISNLETKSSKEQAEFLGKAYALGATAYEDNEEAKEKIHEINKKVYDKSDPEIKNLYEKGKAWSLEYFETLYKRLGTKFTHYYFESEAGKVGIEIVRKHMKGGVFEESDGAVIFPGERYGLHNRVFINSAGLPTYEAKELGLAPTKYKDFQYDQSIIVTGNEINAYFQVLLKALSLVDVSLALKTKHIGHGMVRLPEGKMSSRTGNIITGEWLLDEAKRRVQGSYKEMNDQTAEMVAVAAVKYALLRSSIGRDISFDFDSSISLEGDSGPYIQYTYARTRSVLNKSQISNLKSQINTNEQMFKSLENGKWKMENEEKELLRSIAKFPEVVEEAAGRFAPNMLCNYLFQLSQQFNLFYQKHQIIGPARHARRAREGVAGRDVEDIRDFRVSLTAAAGQVLKNGLYLLGIAAPSKM